MDSSLIDLSSSDAELEPDDSTMASIYDAVDYIYLPHPLKNYWKSKKLEEVVLLIFSLPFSNGIVERIFSILSH